MGWRAAGMLGAVGCNAVAGISEATLREPPGSSGDAAADAPAEAGGDGGAVDGGAEGGWCARRSPQPAFCDDFDEGALSTGFTSVEKQTGTLALDQGSSPPSPPFALLAKAPPLGSGQCAIVDGLRAFPSSSPPARWRLGFDVRVEAYPGSGGLFVANLTLVEDPRSYELWISLFSDGSALSEVSRDPSVDGGAPVTRSILIPHVVPLGTWQTVLLDAALDAKPPTVTVSFDGSTALAQQALSFVPLAGTTYLRAGIASLDGPTTSAEVRIDDLWLDVGP